MAKKVLIVDDELDMRTFISTLLETNGYKPVSAVNGMEGLEMARSKKPVLIILDVMMPKESGINMYRELKSDPELKDIPVIMLSALSRKTFFHSQKVLDEYKGESIPEPDAYIEKPPEPDELLEEIQKKAPNKKKEAFKACLSALREINRLGIDEKTDSILVDRAFELNYSVLQLFLKGKIKKKILKAAMKMPKVRQEDFFDLVEDLKESGPIQKGWPNFSPLNEKKTESIVI